jgi:hypothetical protein
MANHNDTPIAVLEVFRQVDAEADLLFGTGEPSEAELNIIFDSRLSFTDKLTKIRLLRGEVKPKSFANRLTDGDFLHARALGIQLEDEIEQARR